MTVGLAAVAVINAYRHATLAQEYEAAYAGAINVERVNALIYAVVMESRGIYMSPDVATAKPYGDGLLRFNDRIGQVMKDWRGAVSAEDAVAFGGFAKRIQQFQDFRRELVRRGIEIDPAAGREWGDNDASRNVRKALNKNIENLAKVYADRSSQIYSRIGRDIDATAWLLSLLGLSAILLAAAGGFIIRRSIARPLARITGVTTAVAGGQSQVAVPYGERTDEVGALARSIAVFQDTMRRNEELNRTVVDDAQSRAQRQEWVATEIAGFGAEVEASLADLGRISALMMAASTQVAGAGRQGGHPYQRRRHGVGRRVGECPRHRRRRRRARLLGAGDRPSSRAVERHSQQSH